MQTLHAFEHRFEVLVRDIHNHLYANANVRTNEAIASEVAKILLALMHSSEKGVGFTAVLDGQERAAANRGEPTVVARLAAEVQRQFKVMNMELARYPDGTLIGLDEASIAYTRAQLDGVLFASRSRDWLGDALEVFRSMSAKRLGGQFFTDQRVTELSVRLLEFDPEAGDDFIDICAGTGGFLLAAARRIRLVGGEHRVNHVAPPVIHGLEVDPELAGSANGSLISMLGPGASDYVLTADSLVEPGEWSAAVRRRVVPGTHQCLASNPPFGTKITVKDLAILHQYDLARIWRRRANTWEWRTARLSPRPPDILFLERNLRLLEPGRGRMALVTPYQILSGPQLGFVREWILRNARVRAVIDLPIETFQPWTGTKTSLLVLERRKEALDRWDPAADDEHIIFMAVADQIGHDRRGNPVLDGTGEIKTDLPRIGDAFEAFRGGAGASATYENCFAVPASDVVTASDQRLNAAFYRPTTVAARARVGTFGNRKGWRLTTVGEVSQRIFFPTRFKRDYVTGDPSAVPFLGGSQISQLIPTNGKFLSAEASNLDQLRVEPGWILVTRSGSTGVVSSVPEAWAGLAMSEHVIRVVPDPQAVDPEYLEAYLRSSVGQDLLSAGVFGSVIDEITPEHVAGIPIPIPTDRQSIEKVRNTLSGALRARDDAIRGISEAVELVEGLLSS